MSREPYELVEQVSSPGDLYEFIEALRKSLADTPDQWESLTLQDYLEAMSAWLNDSLMSESSAGHASLATAPSWRTFAKILLAASVYE